MIAIYQRQEIKLKTERKHFDHYYKYAKQFVRYIRKCEFPSELTVVAVYIGCNYKYHYLFTRKKKTLHYEKKELYVDYKTVKSFLI